VEEAENCEIREFPASRLATFDTCEIGRRKHYILSLLELDVTDARKALREKKKQGETVSFTSWLIKCIADTCAKYPEIHGVRYKRRKVVLFRDVDISILVEREVEGEPVPLPYVIRRANEKSI